MDIPKLWNPLPTDPHAEAPGQPGSADSERPAATCADPEGQLKHSYFEAKSNSSLFLKLG